METTIVITKWIYRTEKIYEHNVCFYFWSTIILHRLSQDLIGNSKYDYSLRKPPMCSCLFVCTVHLFYEGRYGLNIRTWAPKDRGMIYKKAWWVMKFYYANSFDLCKYLYWYRYTMYQEENLKELYTKDRNVFSGMCFKNQS